MRERKGNNKPALCLWHKGVSVLGYAKPRKAVLVTCGDSCREQKVARRPYSVVYSMARRAVRLPIGQHARPRPQACTARGMLWLAVQAGCSPLVAPRGM